MKCTIPGANMKVLARAIQSLGRIGDELYVEPNEDSLSFRSVNASKSAYASFTFHRPFFSFYKYVPSEQSQPTQGSSRCKISIKSCVPVFRSPVMLDRKVENCIMRIEDNGPKLVFEMRCRYGISKIYYLPIIEYGTLQVVYTKTADMNTLNAPVQVYSDSVHNFLNTQEEITLDVSPEKTFFRSYVDSCQKGAKSKTTEISLNVSEFNSYHVNSANTVTFSLKELRALLLFAEATSLDIEATFGVRGRPINFVVKYEKTYEADFILSTLSPEVDSELPTPQLLNVPNSNSAPVISGGSSGPKGTPVTSNNHPSTSRQPRASVTPSSRLHTLGAKSFLGLSEPRQSFRVPVETPEVPDLNSTNQEKSHSQRSSNSEPSSNLDVSLHDSSTSATGKSVSPSILSAKRKSFCPSAAKALSQNNSVNSSVNESVQQFRSPLMRMDSPDLIGKNGLNGSPLSLEGDLSEEFHLVSPQQLLKRRRVKLFNYTLDVNAIPGHDIILVNDSDDEASVNEKR